MRTSLAKRLQRFIGSMFRVALAGILCLLALPAVSEAHTTIGEPDAPSAGIFGLNQRITPAQGGDHYNPVIVADTSGNLHVAWVHQQGSGSASTYGVYYMSRASTGVAWSTPININGSMQTSSIYGLSLAIDDAGNVYAGWASYSGDLGNIYFTRRSSAGVWSSPVIINNQAGMAGALKIAVDSAGNAYAIWNDKRDGNTNIYFAYRPANGVWSANEKVNDDWTGTDHYVLDIAVSKSGNAYALWTDRRNYGGYEVYSAYRPANGVWGANVNVSDAPALPNWYGNSIYGGDIAVDGAGNAYAIWAYPRVNVGCTHIYFAYRAATLATWGSNVKVDDGTGCASSGIEYPSIVVDSDGKAHAIWIDSRTNPNFDVYYASRLLGGSWGTNSKVNDPGVSDNRFQTGLAIDGAGHLYAVWENSQVSTYPPTNRGIYFATTNRTPINPTSLSSTSHITGVWSNNNVVAVSWSGAVDRSGTGISGYATVWDHAAATVPNTVKNVDATALSAHSPALTDGNWYFHIRAVDNAANWAVGASHLGPFRIDRSAPSSAARSPEYTVSPFSVAWGGTDTGSGVGGYNVWVRDGMPGIWSLWLSNTIATNAVYTNVALGHTYYFRSQARDSAGNVELPASLPQDGDTHTTVVPIQVTGRVLNNRGEPVFNATVSSDPTALNVAASNSQGIYTLFFGASGTYTLTAQRLEYGAQSPVYGQTISSTKTGVDFVLLPSLGEAVVNGTFESGELTPWVTGPGIKATIEMSAAHSGAYGMQLEVASVSADQPCITQSVVISTGWMRPTLSWTYRVISGTADDSLVVSAFSPAKVISQSLALVPGEWTHGWLDLSVLRGDTITLCFGFASTAQSQRVFVDDISTGDSQKGVVSIFLPIVRR